MRDVTIKGMRQGLMLVLPDDSPWDALCVQLKDKLAAAAGLIQGASVQLDLGERALGPDQLGLLVAYMVGSYQLSLTGVIASHDATRAACESLGLSLAAPVAREELAAVAAPAAEASAEKRVPASEAAPAAAPSAAAVLAAAAAPDNNALYLRQTVRSGQSIRHDGTIVICGDVNAGAELIASGDIVVFGTLRGVAHAGATGDEDCHIMAINLRPTQIRIATRIARSPDQAGPPLSKYPEVARVQNSEIHIIPLRDIT